MCFCLFDFSFPIIPSEYDLSFSQYTLQIRFCFFDLAVFPDRTVLVGSISVLLLYVVDLDLQSDWTSVEAKSGGSVFDLRY